MIVIDVTRYGKKLKLEDCMELYDYVHDMLSSVATPGYKGRIAVYPDKVLITQWQAEHIFSNMYPEFGAWETWRGVPIEVQEDIK